MKLVRYENNPILAPDRKSPWESMCVCNPGAWYDGRYVYLLYRAGGNDEEHRISFGLAVSEDGYRFRRTGAKPVFGPSFDGFDAGCVEDPRLTRLGDQFAVTYAARMFPPGRYWQNPTITPHVPALPPDAPLAARENITRSGIALTKDFKTWHRLGPVTSPTTDDRDVVLFPEKVEGEFVFLHRPRSWIGPPYGCEKPSIWMSFADDLLARTEDHLLAQPRFAWEARKIGAGPPPVATKDGWLVIYHGVDESETYRVGAMLLDLKEPMKILARSPTPILEPETIYEKNGLVPNVVFPAGNVVIGERLFVYYGGADTHCCLATVPLARLVGYLLEHPWEGPG